MSRNLTKLLGDSVRTRVAVSELRRMAGDDSDVRLITEIQLAVHWGLIRRTRRVERCIRR